MNDLLDRLRAEFGYHAQANRLDLRVMPCSLTIYSDPRLLEQIMRNLLSNAIKYTKAGRVLVGCRRRGSALSIEFWDTGIGISDSEIKRIFEEYHQVGNPARERSRGLGLGLSIVERLADLLGHKLRVASRPGLGSMFAVEIAQPARVAGAWRLPRTINEGPPPPEVTPRAAGTVLIVEDDHELRELLAIFLREEGHRTSEAVDGVAALALLTKGGMQPDLILADYNLPGGLSGLELCARMRERLHKQLPVIILTGDISTDTLRAVAAAQCMQLTKPVKLEVLSQAIQRLLPPHVPAVHSEAAPAGPGRPVIFVIDDNTEVCQAIRSVLEADGLQVEDFPSCETFLAAYKPGGEGCLVVDAYLPGMTGLELLRLLRDRGHTLPSIMITGRSDVAIAVDAMKAGAADFIEKPISRDALVTAVGRALDLSRDGGKLAAWRAEAQLRVAGLTPRERAIMTMVLAGHPSKNIAADLGISQRTVENHRAAIMKKTGASSLPALARLALAAESG